MKKLAFVFVLAACGGGNNNNQPIDAPSIHEVDAAIDAPAAPDCFSGTPTTHDELINACVGPDVTRIIKHPNLPLMNPDGSLPPLP